MNISYASGTTSKKSASKKSKGVWLALGHQKGDRFEVTRQSESAALTAWTAAVEALYESAEYREALNALGERNIRDVPILAGI